MTLRAVVTDISSVDESVKDFYVEKNGKFVLNVESADGFALENITGLTNALQSERSTRSQLEDKLKTYGDLDPNAARDAMARITDYADLDPRVAREAIATAERLSKFDPEKEADRIAEERFKNSKTQLTTQFQAKETELNGKVETLSQTLARREKQVEHLLKQNAVKSELAKAKPLDDAADVLERIISDSVRLREVDGHYITEIVDENGTPRTKLTNDYNTIPLTVADYVAELREKKASLFRPDDTSGLGLPKNGSPASKTSEKNPWVKGPNWSVTQQMILMNKDQNAARRLMSEAGA